MPRTRSGTSSSSSSSGVDKYTELLRTITLQDEDESVQQQQVQQEKEKSVSVKVRSSSNSFVDALAPLSTESLRILQDTPFHHLLLMDRDVQNTPLIKHLDTLFDTQQCSIHGHALTTQDVTDFLGIQDGEDEEVIQLNTQGHSVKLSTKLKEDFLDKDDDIICVKKINKELNNMKDHDNMKQAFMLLAFQYILCPPADRTLRKSYLQLLDVDDVASLNNKRWTTFVIDNLVRGIQRYKNSKAKLKIPLVGCTLLLQLYATKGSITTPLKCDDKRGKKKHNNDCGKNGLSIERAQMYFHAYNINAMEYTGKTKKQLSKNCKDNLDEQHYMEWLHSKFMRKLEMREIKFDKYLEEYVKELEDN